MMDPEARALVSSALVDSLKPDLVRLAVEVQKKVLERFPLAHGPDPAMLGSMERVDSRDSGARWHMTFDSLGRHVRSHRFEAKPKDGMEGYRIWELAMSYRGPLLAVRSLRNVDAVFEEQPFAEGPFVDWARTIADEFKLCLVEASELEAWLVSSEAMTPEMWRRLGYTDYPSAFQLIFSED